MLLSSASGPDNHSVHYDKLLSGVSNLAAKLIWKAFLFTAMVEVLVPHTALTHIAFVFYTSVLFSCSTGSGGVLKMCYAT